MVVQGEAVPVDQALAADVVPVEHPAGGGERGRVGRRQIGAGERERCRQGAGVEGAAHFHQVQAHGEAGDPALQAAIGGRFGVEQEACREGADGGYLVSQLLPA